MPSQPHQKVSCVFYALLLTLSISTLGSDGNTWAQSNSATGISYTGISYTSNGDRSNGDRSNGDTSDQAGAISQQRDWQPSSRRHVIEEAGTQMQYGGIVDRLQKAPHSSPHSTLRPANHNQLTDQISQSLSAAPRSTAPSSNGDRAIALRPQSIGISNASGVQPVSFQSPSNQRTSMGQAPNEIPNETLEQWSANRQSEAAPSFLEREQSQVDPVVADSRDTISRIGVNLVFVLAIAIGGILLVKQFYRGNQTIAANTPTSLQGLKISQVLRISRHVQLYLVDGATSKVLVAVDAGGIKSVNVLPGHFEDSLDDPAAFSLEDSLAVYREPEPAPEPVKLSRAAARAAREPVSSHVAPGHRIDQESSPELDEKLIKMLLSKSAATT